MPTPVIVDGVNRSGVTPQRRSVARTTRGVARGTTLHKAAPAGRVRPTNRRTSLGPPPSNHAAVGILAWRKTRRPFARPRWVRVFPMSKSSSREATFMIGSVRFNPASASACFVWRSFLQHHVPTDDPFEMAVFGAKEERAVAVQRFGLALEETFTEANGHAPAERGAMFLPFLRN